MAAGRQAGHRSADAEHLPQASLVLLGVYIFFITIIIIISIIIYYFYFNY